jgi:hypothetical protein
MTGAIYSQAFLFLSNTACEALSEKSNQDRPERFAMALVTIFKKQSYVPPVPHSVETAIKMPAHGFTIYWSSRTCSDILSGLTPPKAIAMIQKDLFIMAGPYCHFANNGRANL